MKKRIFLTIFISLLSLLFILGAIPFILTSPWAIRKYFLPAAEKKMRCSITAEKISFDLFDPGNRLVFSNMTVRKKTGKGKEKLFISKAKEVKINFPLKTVFSFPKHGISSLFVQDLSIVYYPQENEEGIKHTFDSVCFSGIAADNKGDFYFRTLLPLSPVQTPEKMLYSEGKGTFSLDKMMTIENLHILLNGTNGKETLLETTLSVDREKDQTYKISSSILSFVLFQ